MKLVHAMTAIHPGEERIIMPEVHKVITIYFPEQMTLSGYRSDAGRIYNLIDKLLAKGEETKHNLMLSPGEFNSKIDDIVKEISNLYSQIEKIQKMKVQHAVRI